MFAELGSLTVSITDNNQTCPYDGDFQCVDNGVCIRATAVCDGSEDCIDGSDEGMNCKYN